MNDDAERISAALTRRFARAPVPVCPAAAWHAPAVGRAVRTSRTGVSRRLAYGAALVLVVAVVGLTAQAATIVKLGFAKFVAAQVSSKPLMPLIPRADRLTVAQAQSRIPFPIVVPVALPANTRLLYAHVVSENPVPRVALAYEAHLGARYYRITFNEATATTGPPVTRLEGRSPRSGTWIWTLPVRRWRHGTVVVELFAPGLPAAVSDRIVRANTM